MQYIPISLIQSSSIQEEYITTKFLFPFRKKSSKRDFVKMLLGLTASHLGGLAVCALYAGTWRKDHTLHCQTTECIYIKPLFTFVTFSLSYLCGTVLGVGTFLSMEGPAEMKRSNNTYGIPFSQIRFQHHPLFCHII